jgi:hypothetical protein
MSFDEAILSLQKRLRGLGVKLCVPPPEDGKSVRDGGLMRSD